MWCVSITDAISESNPRVIDDTRARKLANDLKRSSYYETCATYGLNVERVFQDGQFVLRIPSTSVISVTKKTPVGHSQHSVHSVISVTKKTPVGHSQHSVHSVISVTKKTPVGHSQHSVHSVISVTKKTPVGHSQLSCFCK